MIRYTGGPIKTAHTYNENILIHHIDINAKDQQTVIKFRVSRKDDAKYIVVTRVCVYVCVCVCLCVCPWPHAYTIARTRM